MSGRRLTYDECGKTIVRGTIDAGIKNVIDMELYSGPKMANGRCRKTIDTGTIDRGSTVLGYSMGERRKLVIDVQSLLTFYLKSTETSSARMDTAMPKV